MVVDDLLAAGFGLDYGTVRLERTTEAWIDAASRFQNELEGKLGSLVVSVERVGSSSVPGLLAKPIADLAVGLANDQDLPAIVDKLEEDGWDYVGDAGDHGGHVFVLEARPRLRVAHLHLVDYGGTQWQNYLRFRDLLVGSPKARGQYEAVKLRLAERYRDDRKAYTDGKTAVVEALLADTG